MKSKFQDFSSQGSDSEDSVIGPCSEVNPLFRPLHCNLQFQGGMQLFVNISKIEISKYFIIIYLLEK